MPLLTCSGKSANVWILNFLTGRRLTGFETALFILDFSMDLLVCAIVVADLTLSACLCLAVYLNSTLNLK